jgi:hypothetical protein
VVNVDGHHRLVSLRRPLHYTNPTHQKGCKDGRPRHSTLRVSHLGMSSTYPLEWWYANPRFEYEWAEVEEPEEHPVYVLKSYVIK